MSDDREPFFTPSEWRATVAFRPREWGQWWRTEPRITKILAACLAVMLGYGVYQLRGGNTGVGWPLVIVVVFLVAVLLLAAPLVLCIASGRWVLRKIGVVAWWRVNKYQAQEAAKGFLWLGVIVLIIIGLWPYLSLNPTKSWYAFKARVPVERVAMEKKPHDCDFTTAPLGEKNCHYEARAFVMKDDDTPDKQRSVIVSYEKVQD